MKTVIGLYDDVSTARQVIDELVSAGFNRNDLSLVANNRTGTDTTMGDTTGDTAAEGAVGGAVTGGVLGGLGGVLLGLGALAIPGIGPVVAAGPIVAGLTGAGIGAAVGGLVGALIGWGVPEEEAGFYAEGVRRGGTLVAVKADESLVDKALRIMNRFGPVDVQQRSAEWRSTGWSGFDANAGEYTGTTARTGMTGATKGMGTTGRATSDIKGEKTIPVVEEEMRVGKREVDKGGVRVHSWVEETPVRENVEVREENVYVERRPVDRAVDPSTADAFKERTYEVRQKGEEVVADKQARVVEEVVVGKKVDTHTETVEDNVRRTRVDVEQMGDRDYDSLYRNHFNRTYGNRGLSYERYQPAYRYGSTLYNNPRYAGRDWNDIETDVRRDWEGRGQGAWEDFKDAIREGWNNVKQAVS